MQLTSAIACALLALPQCPALLVHRQPTQPPAPSENGVFVELFKQLKLSGLSTNASGGDQSKGDPTEDLLGNMYTYITETMIPGITSTHNSTQHQLDFFLAAFKRCPSPQTSSGANHLGAGSDTEAKFNEHAQCRQVEGAAAAADETCHHDLGWLANIKNSTCNVLKNLDISSQAEMILCTPKDPYDEWLIMAANKTKTLKDQFTLHKHGCGNATKLHDDKQPE